MFRMIRLDDIIDKVRSYKPDADILAIQKAYIYSAKMHEGQLRKSGEPYLIHPLGVAMIIAEMSLDVPSICAAMLHDVIEDTPSKVEDIRQMFGNEVAFLVEGVTNLSKSEHRFAGKTEEQAENFRKMLVAIARDIRVLLLKLSDRLHNMRTLDPLPPEKRIIKAQETREIYAPLANRLGMENIKAELEDLSFKYLEPQAYNDLKEKLDATHKERNRYIENVSKTLVDLMAEENIPAQVHGRLKHMYSIYKKMKAQAAEFENIHDVIAFRIVTQNVAYCYMALGVVHAHYTPVPERVKDYIAMPKTNSYKSLHTTVIGPEQHRIEVQIRTEEMHRVADFGIAAHWMYKDHALSERDEKSFSWLRELMERNREVADSTEFLETVKIDLFQDEVYVFTPAGKLLIFPAGASTVDFAFAIHTEVGNHCTGARVNGSLVPLKYKLQNGDWVEIITSKNQVPSKDWLEFVVTGRAKQKIRGFIRVEERQRSRQIGKDIMEKELRKLGYSYAKMEKSGELAKLALENHLGGVEELLSALGYGRISKQQALQPLGGPEGPSEPRKELQESTIDRLLQKALGDSGGIQVGGVDNILLRFAKCCNPVYGDAIIGFITRGRGVTIHQASCSKAQTLDPERRVDVKWDPKTTMPRPVSIRVTTTDRAGILSTITNVFLTNNINLKSAHSYAVTTDRAVHIFIFDVKDVNQLKSISRALENTRGVYTVERLISLSQTGK